MEAEDAFIFCNDALPGESFPAFETMRRNGEYCDLIVKVEEKYISAHRMIVAANIPYFRSMLDKGKGDGCVSEQINIQKMNPDAVESLIEYAYTGKVSITPSNVTVLLSSAKHFQVDVVRDACCEFLVKRLHPNNVLRTREFAENMGCSKLVETADWYVRENFDEVSLSEEFLELPLFYIKGLICRDDLCTASEEKVLEAILKWVKKLPAERKVKLPELLNDIRMPFITLRYLSENVVKEELIQESIICRDLIDEARNYHLFPSKMSQFSKFTVHPRCTKSQSAAQATSNKAGIYAVCDISPTERTVQRFDPQTEEWHVIGMRTDGLYGDAVVSMGQKLYIFGGKGSRYVQVFDLKTFIWTVIQPMGTERYSAAAGAHHGQLYVCGGCDYLGKSLSTVECYDPESKKWTSVVSMSKGRHGAAVVSLGKYIYVLGGKQDSGFLNSVGKLDTKSAELKWADVPSMIEARAGFGACMMNGRIYVCGGESGSYYSYHGNEVYDPLIDKWYQISGFQRCRERPSLVSLNGKLYAFNGKHNSKSSNTYEVYNAEDNKWEQSNVIFRMENFVGIVAINNP